MRDWNQTGQDESDPVVALGLALLCAIVGLALIGLALVLWG